MPRLCLPASRVAVSVFALLAITLGCSGDGGTTAPATAPFEAVAHTPGEGDEVYLNDPVTLSFSTAIDLASVTPATFAVVELEAGGTPTEAPVAGSYQLSDDGTMLWFSPNLPTDGAYATGGLRQSRTYRVHATDGLRDLAGKPLQTAVAFTFRTRGGNSAAELFRDRKAHGPARTTFTVTNDDLGAVPLNRFGQPPTEVRLAFDQPLDPAIDNLAPSLWLEYQDPADLVGVRRRLATELELERNTNDGATVVLRPLGVLPNAANVIAVVAASVRDLAGQDNTQTPNYDVRFGTFRTEAAWLPQWNAVVERFEALNKLDAAAPFAEPRMEAGPGWIRAARAFEGGSDTIDFVAPAAETVLNTAYTTFAPTTGPLQEVTGGVFRLRNLTIPAGSFVQGTGPHPLVFVCRGKVVIDGTLTVRGGDGTRSNGISIQYSGPHDTVLAGQTSPGTGNGTGRCGGGNGGAGSPNASVRDFRGSTGRGAGQQPEAGGAGGYLACVTGCYTSGGYNGSGGASGGGGGSAATQGDPHFRGATPATILPNTPPTGNTRFQQVRGYGGAGCGGASGTRVAFLLGGEPAPIHFQDARNDNNFFGDGFDVRRQLRIHGELAELRGGGGGGGGGDTSPLFDCSLTGNSPAFDYRGGGGGGGGGVLVVQAHGEIWIRANGTVSADGGHGGGGEQVGACGEAGGGGGGAGGMVVLMSATAIRIEAHGNVGTNRFVYGGGTTPMLGDEYSFAVSADGGVCRTGGFGAVYVAGKYAPAGQPPIAGTSYDTEPLGGFGGMGLVQLMVPPGDDSDGTGTILDDNIHWYMPGSLASSASIPLGPLHKRQLLAWRGHAQPDGTYVNDHGTLLNVGKDEGDIRPAPILLPSPYGPRSRARSQWIDLGAIHRRPLTAPDQHARGVVLDPGAAAGPWFAPLGLRPDGYVPWFQVANATQPEATVAVAATPLASIEADATFHGAPAYRALLTIPLADPRRDRFAGFDAELIGGAGEVRQALRIVAHDANALVLAADALLQADGATHVRIVARPFHVRTEASALLPSTFVGTTPVPTANVRIGFAFHTDPNGAAGTRFPAASNTFAHDLQSPDLLQFLAAQKPRFLMWDVLADQAYHGGGATPVPSLTRPRLELHELRLPFGF